MEKFKDVKTQEPYLKVSFEQNKYQSEKILGFKSIA